MILTHASNKKQVVSMILAQSSMALVCEFGSLNGLSMGSMILLTMIKTKIKLSNPLYKDVLGFPFSSESSED